MARCQAHFVTPTCKATTAPNTPGAQTFYFKLANNACFAFCSAGRRSGNTQHAPSPTTWTLHQHAPDTKTPTPVPVKVTFARVCEGERVYRVKATFEPGMSYALGAHPNAPGYVSITIPSAPPTAPPPPAAP